jgi:hypothetical protein
LFQYSGIDVRIVKLYASTGQIDGRERSNNASGSDGESDDDDEDGLLDYIGSPLDDGDDDHDSSDVVTCRVTGVRVVPVALLLRVQRRLFPRDKARRVNLDDLQCDDDSIDECQVCHRQFSSAAMRERHACSGAPRKRDAVAYCVTKAVEMNRSGQLDVLTGADFTESSISWLTDTRQQSRFKAGWARRPPHGDGYGVKYANRFSDELVEMFGRGVVDKSCKMCMWLA